jgi:hypothetical protein
VLDPQYVVARSVLLDVLEALGGQRQAVVFVGAQAFLPRSHEGTKKSKGPGVENKAPSSGLRVFVALALMRVLIAPMLLQARYVSRFERQPGNRRDLHAHRQHRAGGSRVHD